MEFNTPRLIAALLMAVGGLVYFLNTEKAYRFLYRRSEEDEVSGSTIRRFKYGGLVVSLIGTYYVLAMYEILPKIDY